MEQKEAPFFGFSAEVVKELIELVPTQSLKNIAVDNPKFAQIIQENSRALSAVLLYNIVIQPASKLNRKDSISNQLGYHILGKDDLFRMTMYSELLLERRALTNNKLAAFLAKWSGNAEIATKMLQRIWQMLLNPDPNLASPKPKREHPFKVETSFQAFLVDYRDGTNEESSIDEITVQMSKLIANLPAPEVADWTLIWTRWSNLEELRRFKKALNSPLVEFCGLVADLINDHSQILRLYLDEIREPEQTLLKEFVRIWKEFSLSLQ